MSLHHKCSSPTTEDTLQFLNTQRETPTCHTNIRSLWSILLGSLELVGSNLLEGDKNLKLKVEDIIATVNQHLKL